MVEKNKIAKVLILGDDGVGKSTIGNRLLGASKFRLESLLNCVNGHLAVQVSSDLKFEVMDPQASLSFREVQGKVQSRLKLLDKLDAIVMVFPSEAVKEVPGYAKDMITVVEILTPQLLVIVFTKCGQISHDRDFRDKILALVDQRGYTQPQSISFYLHEEFPDQVDDDHLLRKQLQGGSKDDLKRWLINKLDQSAPKIDMQQLQKQGYSSLSLAGQGSQVSMPERDPFEQDDQFGCRDGCCQIF